MLWKTDYVPGLNPLAYLWALVVQTAARRRRKNVK